MFQSICCQYLENGEFSNGKPTSALCSNRYRKQSTVVIEKLHTYARFIYKTTGTPNLQISVTLILASNVSHRTHYGVNESNQIQQIPLNILAFGDANLSIIFQVIFAKNGIRLFVIAYVVEHDAKLSENKYMINRRLLWLHLLCVDFIKRCATMILVVFYTKLIDLFVK